MKQIRELYKNIKQATETGHNSPLRCPMDVVKKCQGDKTQCSNQTSGCC